MKQLVIVLAVVLAVARHAHADPAAEQLFRDGQDLMKQGKVAEACDRFRRSQKLEPRTGTLLNLGSCLEQLGMTASAWETFMEAKAAAITAGDTRRATESNRRAAALKPKLAYITVSVPSDRVVEGFELRRNGTSIDPAVWNVAVPIDPGDYEVVARAPGHESWSGKQTIAAGQRATIVVERLAKVASVTPTAPVGPPKTTISATTTQQPAPAVVKANVPGAPRWGIGVTVGETSDIDPMFGVRVVRNIGLTKGALRGAVSALYDHFLDDPTNGFMESDQLLIGGGAEYVWLTPQFAFSAGVNAGIDVLFRNANRGTDAGPWWGARLSPVIVRLVDGQLEAGIHLHGIQSTDRLVAFGLVGLDWYVR